MFTHKEGVPPGRTVLDWTECTDKNTSRVAKETTSRFSLLIVSRLYAIFRRTFVYLQVHASFLKVKHLSMHNSFYHTIFQQQVLFNPLSTGQSKIGRRRPIRLDYHCVNISQRIFINKILLERSFHYLNADTLVWKIGQEMTPLQPFEVTQLIDFALDRSTSVTCGRDFAHSITMVTWNV